MKKVVDGKLYDTDTAEKIHGWSNGLNSGDFSWCRETVYKTAKGSIFLHGERGPASPHAKKAENMLIGSSDTRPLTEEQAVAWLQSHEGTEPLLVLFPDRVSEA